mmetsp:Transcript_65099/g.160275  ORF Transcript_65099/g.160275 Transcript_65099/m.160275 type:complete len:226 (-) Transcript_65099:707-1384(-)
MSLDQALCVVSPNMIELPRPNHTPLEMECERGIREMVRKDGSATLVSAHSICPTSRIIIEPIRTSTGADATVGIALKSGAKKRETANRKAAVRAHSPVRPPSRIPDVHSTAMIIGEHPVHDARMVPTPEATRAHVPPGTDSPTFEISPAFMDSPTKQPEQSKRATRRKVRTAGMPIAGEKSLKSIFMKDSASCGIAKTCAGHELSTDQKTMAHVVTPTRMPPLTL